MQQQQRRATTTTRALPNLHNNTNRTTNDNDKGHRRYQWEPNEITRLLAFSIGHRQRPTDATVPHDDSRAQRTVPALDVPACVSLSFSHTHSAHTVGINPNGSNNASDPSKGNDALTGIFRDGPSVDAFSWPLPICSQHTQQQTKHQSRGIIFLCSVSLVPTQDHHVRNITSVVVKYGSSIDPNQHDTPNHEAKSSSSSFMISAVVATDDYLD